MTLTELRIWHWKQAMEQRKEELKCKERLDNEPTMYIGARTTLLNTARDWYVGANFHIAACQALNDVLPGTGEQDCAKAAADGGEYKGSPRWWDRPGYAEDFADAVEARFGPAGNSPIRKHTVQVPPASERDAELGTRLHRADIAKRLQNSMNAAPNSIGAEVSKVTLGQAVDALTSYPANAAHPDVDSLQRYVPTEIWDGGAGLAKSKTGPAVMYADVCALLRPKV